jgi:hypothetical protein
MVEILKVSHPTPPCFVEPLKIGGEPLVRPPARNGNNDPRAYLSPRSREHELPVELPLFTDVDPDDVSDVDLFDFDAESTTGA